MAIVNSISAVINGGSKISRKSKYLSQDIEKIVNAVASEWGRNVSDSKSKLMDMIRKLSVNYSTEIRTLKLGEAEKEFIIYKGSKTTGANQGYWAKLKDSDELFLVKYGAEEQVRSEQLANELYELGGILTSKQFVITEKMSKKIGTASKFVPIDGLPTGADSMLVREGFGMDCWLSNWDALKRGNVVLSDGKAIRIDNGGALCYRARGARKTCTEFGENVNELRTFFEQYSLSKPYLTDMTREELISSLDRVCKISDKKIIDTVNKSACYKEAHFGFIKYNYETGTFGQIGEPIISAEGVQNPEFIKEMLIARKNYISRFKTQCLITPQKQGETIADYIRRIDSSVKKTEYTIPFDKIPMSDRVHEGTMLSMAEWLTPSQKRLYEESLRAYKETFKNKIYHPNANEILAQDSMLHATSAQNLQDILTKGLTTSDVRGAIGQGTGDKTLTPLCADFWDIKEKVSIKDYFSKPDWKFNKGETNFLPTKSNDRNSIVIVVDKNSVNPVTMKNSFLVRMWHKGSILFKDGNIKPHYEYITHRAVPIGVTPNAIDRIIIRREAFTQNAINQMQELIQSKGLDIKIYDLDGNMIYAGLKDVKNAGISFMHEFLSSANKSTDELIKAYRFELWGKRGLPLKYSRQEFVYEINQILKTLPEKERTIFLKKFNLSKNKLGDIDGIPNIRGFSPKSIQEAEMVSAIERFYQNEIMLENPKAKAVLDSIIKEFPEFNMMIGKVQHATHEFSVDIHTLSVLQKVIKNPAYNVLSEEGKQVVKLSVLMHDFGKMGGILTRGHEKISKGYAEKILGNYNLPNEIKSRVLNLVENHHWFKEYNKGRINAEDVARMFKSPEDRIIAILMAKADFESINQTCHLKKLIDGQYLTPKQYEDNFFGIIKTLQADMFLADL